MKKSTIIITGLLICIAISGLYFGINYLKGKNVFNPAKEYYIVYQRIDGLQISAPVMISGFKVGQVRNISLMPDHSGRLLVTITLKEDNTLPLGTVARIFSSDLMGTKSIELQYGNRLDFHQPGDTLIPDFEGSLQEMVSLQMAPLKSQAESLMKQMQEAMTAIEYIFNDQTKQDIIESFANMKKTFINLENSSVVLDSMFSHQKGRIDRILNNAELITRNLNLQEKNIANSLQNISDISDSLSNSNLKQTVLEIQTAMVQLNVLLAKINSGEGTLGQLMNNDSLYSNLEQLSYNLTVLSEDLRVNPKRYTHFAAFDLGKTVYVAENDKPIKGRLVYKIEIVRSEQPIEIKPDNFKGYENVEEIVQNGIYIYLYGSKNKLSKAQELLLEIKKDFPDASIIELKGGKIIRSKL